MINKPYLLALNRIPAIGPRTVMKLLRQWPVLADLFNTPYAALLDAGLPDKMARAIERFEHRILDTDTAWQQSSPQHHLLTWEHDAYPDLLREIHDPPVVLYAIGDLAALKQPCIAMVGTRKPSVSGSETAEHFAFELASRQITVVSGLALGIDARAHTGCVAAGGKTIAVMGTGIDRIYPRQHHQLADKLSKNGLLLSEFPLNSPSSAGHFPRRNRIISGLSLATLVVEAALRSGSLITARLALEQNREVMAVPGSIHNPQSRGCHFLLQQGAKLVTSTEDILEELKLTIPDKKANQSRSSLATNNKNLVKCIGFETTTVDQIVNRSGLNVEEVVSDLAILELEGIVKSVPGGYMRCAYER